MMVRPGWRKLCLHRLAVKPAVDLRPRALDGGALASVQQTKLDAGTVSHAAHHAVQGINFPDQVALSKPANRRVAGHGTNRLSPQGHKCGPGAHSG
jgi:hypothetical protein